MKIAISILTFAILATCVAPQWCQGAETSTCSVEVEPVELRAEKAAALLQRARSLASESPLEPSAASRSHHPPESQKGSSTDVPEEPFALNSEKQIIANGGTMCGPGALAITAIAAPNEARQAGETNANSFPMKEAMALNLAKASMEVQRNKVDCVPISTIVKGINKAVAETTSAVNTATSAVTSAANQVQSFTKDAASAVKDAANKGTDVLAKASQGAIKAARQAQSALQEAQAQATAAANAVATATKNAASAAAAAAADASNTALKEAASAASKAKAAAQTAFNKAEAAVKTAANAVADAAQVVANGVQMLISICANFMDALRQLLSDCLGSIASNDVVRQAVDLLSQCSSPSGCRDMLSSAGQKLLDIIQSGMSSVYQPIVKGVMGSVNQVTNMMSNMIPKLQAVVTSIGAAAVSTAQAISNFATGTAKAIGNLAVMDFCTPADMGFMTISVSDCNAFSDIQKLWTRPPWEFPDNFMNTLGDFKTCLSKRNLMSMPTPFMDINLRPFCLPQFIQTPLKALSGTFRYFIKQLAAAGSGCSGQGGQEPLCKLVMDIKNVGVQLKNVLTNQVSLAQVASESLDGTGSCQAKDFYMKAGVAVAVSISAVAFELVFEGVGGCRDGSGFFNLNLGFEGKATLLGVPTDVKLEAAPSVQIGFAVETLEDEPFGWGGFLEIEGTLDLKFIGIPLNGKLALGFTLLPDIQIPHGATIEMEMGNSDAKLIQKHVNYAVSRADTDELKVLAAIAAAANALASADISQHMQQAFATEHGHVLDHAVAAMHNFSAVQAYVRKTNHQARSENRDAPIQFSSGLQFAICLTCAESGNPTTESPGSSAPVVTTMTTTMACVNCPPMSSWWPSTTAFKMTTTTTTKTTTATSTKAGPAVAGQVLYGPAIASGGTVPVQQISYLNTGELVYIGVEGPYTKMVTASGTAKYYSGPLSAFNPGSWSTYTSNTGNYLLSGPLPAVAGQVLYGPFIVNPKPVQAIRYLGSQGNYQLVYMIYDDSYTKMVSASGDARYYSGPIGEFNAGSWSSYASANGNYILSPAIPAVAGQTLYGPWIGNPVPVQAIRYLTTGELVYMIYDDSYTKMVSASGDARYYSGPLSAFKPSSWSSYASANRNYKLATSL